MFLGPWLGPFSILSKGVGDICPQRPGQVEQRAEPVVMNKIEGELKEKRKEKGKISLQ